MEHIQQLLLPIVRTVNAYLADYVLIALLVGAGLFFSLKTRFVQIRYFGSGLKQFLGGVNLFGGKQHGGMSSFQALATAIAGQVGTGNIVGASGAILVGGPGAIFWMWILAFLGMATIYAEAVLAQETRVTDANGTIHGGPVYYIRKAYSGKFGKALAVFFSVAIVIALGFMGCMLQSNSIAQACNTAFGLPGWVVGLFLAVVSAFIFLGGVDRLASVTEKIVPIMAAMFLVGGTIVLCIRIRYIPETIGMIIKYAFMPEAIIGGGAGYALKIAISQGAKRGLFSNEAGMGSTPHAHAQANVKCPHDQGIVAMIGVFIDTFVFLTMTALVVISCLYAGNGPMVSGTGALITNTSAMPTAFATALSVVFNAETSAAIGNIFVAVCLLFFAYSTVLSWNFFGKINILYLFRGSKTAGVVYSCIAIGFLFLGTLLSNDLVWELTDFFNYLMVLPNVMALIPLAGIVAKAAGVKKD
jgi:AGCS family alanine or glycine:cation symporter